MIEIERSKQSPFVTCIIGDPYNKKVTKEITELLEKTTGRITSRGLNVVNDPSHADLCIVIDAVPKKLIDYAKNGRVILVTAQKRSKQSLNIYLRECKQKTQSHWNNVKVVNIDPEDKNRLVQKWWDLNVAVFGLVEHYSES